MNESGHKIKLSFITGLGDVVLNEISQYKGLHVDNKGESIFYLDYIQNLNKIKHLRSISQAYVIIQDSKFNPLYIVKHKSILSDLINTVILGDKNAFKSFKVICAGPNSPEVRGIAEYIQKTYGLIEKREADLKVHIVKNPDKIWEIGVQITPRPLSFRDYKIKNMSGAMDPTIAYAINSLCNLGNVSSYLNIFSGSATLLIEAGLSYPNLNQLVGFDNDKKHISLAIQNIKKAGLIKRIQLKEKDIFNRPDLGKFEVITSDLPFGMAVSKGEDLEKLYGCFIEYCEKSLNHGGKLAVYTSEYDILEKIIQKSKFKIIKTLELKFITAVDAYLRPKIFVCELK